MSSLHRVLPAIITLTLAFVFVSPSPTSADSSSLSIYAQGYGGQLTIADGRAWVSYMPNTETTAIAEYSNGAWQSPTVIDNISDSHGLGFTLVDSSGYLHSFYGAHDTELFQKVSNAPLDSSAWTSTTSPELTGATYPIAYTLKNGTIALFYRFTYDEGEGGKTTWVFRVSTDEGVTWGARQYVINSSDIHSEYGTNQYCQFQLQETASGEEIVHITFNDATVSNAPTARKKIEYVKLNLSTGHLYKADGTDMGGSIDSSNYAQVYAYSTNVQCWYANVDGDPLGNPYIVWTRQYAVGKYRYSMIYWTGSAWSSVSDIAEHPALVGQVVPTVRANGDLLTYFVNSTSSSTSSGGGLYSSTWTKASATWSSPILLLDNYSLPGADKNYELYPMTKSYGYFGSPATIVIGESPTTSSGWTDLDMFVYSEQYGFLVNGTSLEWDYSPIPRLAGPLAVIGLGLVAVYVVNRELHLDELLEDLLRRMKD